MTMMMKIYRKKFKIIQTLRAKAIIIKHWKEGINHQKIQKVIKIEKLMKYYFKKKMRTKWTIK